MSCKKLFNGIRVRPCRVGGDWRIEELKEALRGARREVVDRMSDDVGVNMLAKVEANRKPARAGALRVVVANARDSQNPRSGPSPAWNSGADAAPLPAKRLPTTA
jgi:hypothetical protein